MKILLDENLPRKLLPALKAEGHEVESIHTLHLEGAANGVLSELAERDYDVCFTRDAGFAHNVRQGKRPARFKLLRVVLAQQEQDDFVREFMAHFRNSRWEDYEHGVDWPKQDHVQ